MEEHIKYLNKVSNYMGCGIIEYAAAFLFICIGIGMLFVETINSSVLPFILALWMIERGQVKLLRVAYNEWRDVDEIPTNL